MCHAFARIILPIISEGKGNLLQKMDLVEGVAFPPFVDIPKITMIDGMRGEYGDRRADYKKSLPEILLQFAASQATEDKDRVFALLGSSSAAADKTLLPDYLPPVKDIYEAVARHSLRSRNPFFYFSAAGVANRK
jgi:hypothetical protein